jgi:hypothetical protein
MRLRIESVNGSPINDYRIRDGCVELRLLDPSGHEYPGYGSRWRMLNANDMQLHHALGTVVSRWLEERLGAGFLDMKRAA